MTSSSLSRSMAHFDFHPEQPTATAATNSRPTRTRHQLKSSKRDLSQSCSAFNFTLDPSEVGIGMDESRKRSNSKGSSKKSDAAATATKPSYSDLVMDATARSHYPAENMINDSRNTEKFSSAASAAKSPRNHSRPTTSRIIPPSNDMHNNRRHQRGAGLGRSNSNHEIVNEESVRADSRRLRRHSTVQGRSGHAMHMSMQEFPHPSDIDSGGGGGRGLPARTASTSSTQSQSRRRSKSPHRNSANERFSKSFSGFGDWDPNELLNNSNDCDDISEDGTVPQFNSTAAASASTRPRRGGRKPLMARSSRDTKSATNRYSDPEEGGGDEFLECAHDSFNSNPNQQMHEILGGSFPELEPDLLPEVPKQASSSRKIPPTTRGVPASRRSFKGNAAMNNRRFSNSCSAFEVAPNDLMSTTTNGSSSTESTTGTPKRKPSGRRRSVADVGVAQTAAMLASPRPPKGGMIQVETERVSLEEFHSSFTSDLNDDFGETIDDNEEELECPPASRSNSRIDQDGGASRSNPRRRPRGPGATSSSSRHPSSGPRIRRTMSHDGSVRHIRGCSSSHPELGGGPRRYKRSDSKNAEDNLTRSPPHNHHDDAGSRLTHSHVAAQEVNKTGSDIPVSPATRRRNTSGERHRRASCGVMGASDRHLVEHEAELRPQTQRRMPRRTRSGDSMMQSMRSVVSTRDEAPPAGGGRRGPEFRRTNSSDGGIPIRRRDNKPDPTKLTLEEKKAQLERLAREREKFDAKYVQAKQARELEQHNHKGTSSSPVSKPSRNDDGDNDPNRSASSGLSRSLANVSKASTDRRTPSRTMSSHRIAGTDRSVVSRAERSVSSSGSNGSNGISKSPSARRTVPKRAKSHDGSITLGSARDKGSGSTEGRNARRPVPADDEGRTKAVDAIQRRAMAHSLLKE